MRMEATSRFDAGSSRTRSCGSWADTLAQAIFCFSPPESLNRLRSSRSSSPKRTTTPAIAASMSVGAHPMFSHPKASSLVVSTLKNWLRGFWNTLPTRVARRVMGSTDGSTPSTSARPHRSPS